MIRTLARMAGSQQRLLGSSSPSCLATHFSAAAAAGSSSGTAAVGGGKQGPVFIVFGATGGIGSALVQRLAGCASAGASLMLSADHDSKLQELKGRLGSGGGSCSIDVMAADACNPDQVEAVVQRVMQSHGRIDGVANCVGNVVAASALATDLQRLRDTLQLNLFSSFNIVKSTIKALVGEEGAAAGADSQGPQAAGKHDGPGGSIVLVSAAVASHGLPNYEAMSAAKAAVEGLARSAAATYATHNVRINCVAPGLTRTPQTKRFTDNSNVAGASEQMHPLKELGSPHQVAAALEFFLRPENDFITGQVLAVDGGLSTLHPHHAQDFGV